MSEQEVKFIEPSAVVVREQVQAVERANLSIDEVHEQLAFIRQVMAREMKEGQDYGKIPGCGDKPGLFQPGAQKLLLTFQLTPHVKKEVLRDLPHPTIFGHREYEFTLTLRSKVGREWDGVGTCSTLESKYRYRKSSRKCPNCGKETIFKDKNPPHGFYCWVKKGGCGNKFAPDDKAITGQEEGKADNDNPAEFWNTVRKMAFKRALVHGSINATNTSELWSQDLEDLPQANSAASEYIPEPTESFENAPQGVATPKPPQDTTQGVKIDCSHVSGPAKASPEAPATKIGPKYRMTTLNKLQAAPGGHRRSIVHEYLTVKGHILSTEQPEDWPLHKLPKTAEEFFALGEDIQQFELDRREGRAVQP